MHVSLPLVPRTPQTARAPTTVSASGGSASTALVHYAPGAVASGDTRPSSRVPRLLQSMNGSPNGTFQLNATNGSTASAASRLGSSFRGLSSLPKVAKDIDEYIQRELLKLSKNHEHCSVFERLPIIAEAFNAFISRCGEYKELLSRIKTEYDEAVAEGLKATRTNQRLELVNDNSMEYLSHIVLAEKISFEAQLREKDKQIKELHNSLEQRAKEYTDTIEEDRELRAKVQHLTKIVEDLSLKNNILTDGLKQETLHRSLMVQQGKKLKADNEKLLKKVQMLEYRIKSDALLVSTEGGLDEGPSGSHSPVMSPQQSTVTRARHDSPNSTLRRNPSVAGGKTSGDGGVEAVTSGTYDADPETRLAAEEQLRRALFLLLKERRLRQSLEDQLKESASTRIDRPLTPRPNWTHQLRSILPRYTVPRASSDEILKEVVELIRERLLQEKKEIEIAAMSKTIRSWMGEENLCESDLVRSRGSSFIGLGNGTDVPEYLKFHGHLRNRQLPKGDVENILKDFWKDRRLRMNGGGGMGGGEDQQPIMLDSIPIQEFFLEWLMRKTGNRTSAIELAYNIVDVCSRFTTDPDCGMFLQILSRSVNEAAYWDQLSVVDQLQMVMRHHDKSSVGLLRRARVHLILLKVFPAKAFEPMLKLRFTLLSHLNTASDTIRYAELFEEDAEGNQSRFVELVREQHLREMTEYIVDISEAIRSVTNDGVASVAQIRNAIRFLDMNIPSTKLEAILACGLDLPNTTPDMDSDTVVGEKFIRRIREGILLMPHTRKLSDEVDADESSSMRVNLEDELNDSDLDDFDFDESEVDPSAKAALEQMDQQLLGSSSAFVRQKSSVPLPAVAESAVSLLNPQTVEAMQKSLGARIKK